MKTNMLIGREPLFLLPASCSTDRANRLGLLSGWTGSVIVGGGGNNGGAFSYEGEFTVSGQSGIIGVTSDGLHFASVPLVSDGMIIARMLCYAAQGNSDAGVMLRTRPTPTAAMMYWRADMSSMFSTLTELCAVRLDALYRKPQTVRLSGNNLPISNQ